MGNNKNTDEILNSLEGVKRAAPAGFFYTRLRARMEKEPGKAPSMPRVLRPVWIIGMLAVVLIINAAVILRSGTTTNTSTASESEKLQSIAADYNMNDVSSLYDLNEDK